MFGAAPPALRKPYRAKKERDDTDQDHDRAVERTQRIVQTGDEGRRQRNGAQDGVSQVLPRIQPESGRRFLVEDAQVADDAEQEQDGPPVVNLVTLTQRSSP